MKISKAVYFATTIFLLQSCGGGGDSGDGDSSVLTGQFIDSEVGGLSYKTKTQSGKTDSSGKFKYKAGEVVTFSIGGLLIGAHPGQETVTPVEVANAFNSDDPRAQNIARLLQSLDSDNNPDNGIDLIEEAEDLADSIDLDDENSIQQGLDSIGGGVSLVSLNDALTHLQASLAALPAPDIASSYSFVTGYNWPSDDDCAVTSWAGATLSTTDSTNGTSYAGTLTRSDTGTENFNLEGSSRGTTDAGTNIYISADQHAAEITIGTGVEVGVCRGTLWMTADPNSNLPPIAGRNSPYTIQICQSSSATYFWGFDGLAYDKDGYIAKHPTFKYTIDGQAEVQLVVGANDQFSNFIGGRMNKRVDRAEILNVPCTSGFTWEYIVEDNEGEISTDSGSYEAPFESSGGIGGDSCVDDYPSLSCDLLEGQFSVNNSCSSAFPNATELDLDLTCTSNEVFTCGACEYGNNLLQ
jgi:hypothetical protein